MVEVKEKSELAITKLLGGGSNIYFFTCSPFRSK